MSRAGLVSLFLFFLSASLVASAPVTERLSSFSIRYDNEGADLVGRPLRTGNSEIADPVYITREYLFTFDDREFEDLECDEYTKREYLSFLDSREFDEFVGDDPAECDDAVSEFPVLYRRNIFSKMRDGFRSLGRKVSNGFQSFGRKTQAGFQKLGRKVNTPFQRLGGKIRSGLQNIGGKVNSGFQKFGGKVNTSFRKVKAGLHKAGRVLNKGFRAAGQFIKKNGAKIAKVGLKLYAAQASVAAKLVKFIPGVGQPLSMALKGVAMGANIGSSQIHADMSGKFGEVSNGIDYVIDPVGSVGKLAVKGMAKQGGGVGEAGNIISSIMF